MEEESGGFFAYRSVARVERYTIRPKSGVGRSLTYTVVFLAPAIERRLTFGRGNRLRFVGELDGIPLQGAWQSSPGRGHYAMLNATTLARAERAVGDETVLAFNVVDEDEVVVPDDVARALRSPKRLATAWAELSASAKRASVAASEAARRPETRARRIATLIATLTTGAPRVPRRDRSEGR